MVRGEILLLFSTGLVVFFDSNTDSIQPDFENPRTLCVFIIDSKGSGAGGEIWKNSRKWLYLAKAINGQVPKFIEEQVTWSMGDILKNPDIKEPSFYEIVWSVALRKFIDYNKSYDDLMNEKDFLEKLRTNPDKSIKKEIREHLVKNFLNKWGCRITKSKYDVVSSELTEFFIKNTELFHLGENILTFDFNKYEEQLITLFKKLDKIKEIGPTGVSKILHVLNPDLFVMWDIEIAEKLKFKHAPKGYFTFLKKMQKDAINIAKTFYFEGDVEKFLNEYFKLTPRSTLAKFLDEYNWAKYSKGWNFPPEWDPKILIPPK